MNLHFGVLAIAVALLCGCNTDVTPESQAKSIDDNDGRYWSTGDPATLGFDAKKLAAVRDYAFQADHHTQSVLIIRHGQIAAEWYRDGVTKDSWATSWSVAKSYASALIGIAIDEGLIESVDQAVSTWIPEWNGTDNAKITLKHVLGMATGLDYTETYDFLGDNDVRDMLFENDHLTFALQQTAASPPGTTWYYNSANTMLLSRILERATGMSVDDYARKKLFEPLGMSKVEWWQDGQGNTLTYCCIDTTSRDFARFGQLFLQKGRWAGEQIVSEAWVAESVQPSQPDYAGYGYKWWLNTEGEPDSWTTAPLDMYAAIGRDYQYIFVFPTQEMVVVRNGDYVKPDHPPVAPEGLFAAGLFIHGVGPTGSTGPIEGTWDDNQFLALVMDALAIP